MLVRIGFPMILVAMVGCTSERPAALEVDALTVSGELDGTPLDETLFVTPSGQRVGNSGFFTAGGPSGSMELTACPLTSMGGDPYATLNPPSDVPGDGPAVSSDCDGRGLVLCDGARCGNFDLEDVTMEVTDLDTQRRVTLDAINETGAVHVEVLYREHG